MSYIKRQWSHNDHLWSMPLPLWHSWPTLAAQAPGACPPTECQTRCTGECPHPHWWSQHGMCRCLSCSPPGQWPLAGPTQCNRAQIHTSIYTTAPMCGKIMDWKKGQDETSADRYVRQKCYSVYIYIDIYTHWVQQDLRQKFYSVGNITIWIHIGCSKIHRHERKQHQIIKRT